MQTKFVQVLCDIDCKWKSVFPKYRIFVNDEMFTERTWIWRDTYIEELIQLQAPAGQYQLRFELVEPKGKLLVSNIRIKSGDAKILDKNVLEIH